MNFDGLETPIEHYDMRLKEIDEEICKLIEQRKLVSKNPGCPTDELIRSWAQQYDMYENFLMVLFGHMRSIEDFSPSIEPKEFVKNIPVLQSYEKDGLLYTITYIRQYENASVVSLMIEHEAFGDENDADFQHQIFAQDFLLDIEDNSKTAYTCQNGGGGGFNGYMAFQFIVSPALPEEMTAIKLTFKERENRYDSNHKGIEFVIGS